MGISSLLLKSLTDIIEEFNIPLVHADLERLAKDFVIYNASGSTTTFHFMACKNVIRAVENKSIEKFRRTCGTSGDFRMLDGSSKSLKVCPFCLSEWAYGNGWEGYSKVSAKDKARIKKKFTISEFFAKIAVLSDFDRWKNIDIPPEITSSPADPKIFVPGCYVIYSPNVPSAGFHFMDCSILKADCAHEWTGGYRTTSDLSGIFTVYVKKDGNKIPEPRNLKVCPVCLAEYNNNQGWKNFSLNDEQKKLIYDFTIKGHSTILKAFYSSLDTKQKAAITKFSIEEFFKACNYKSQIPGEILDKIWACNIDPDNPYPTGWQPPDYYISRLHRIAARYRCEMCGVDLSSHKDLVILHHINGLHPDVRSENFKVLCKLCHSEQWRHDTTVKITEGEKYIIESARREQKLPQPVKND